MTPQEIITIAQDRRADLIVVGSRGHGRLAGLLLDSVAQKLISLAPRPCRGRRLPVDSGSPPSNPLPQAGLLVEAIQLNTAEIET